MKWKDETVKECGRRGKSTPRVLIFEDLKEKEQQRPERLADLKPLKLRVPRA